MDYDQIVLQEIGNPHRKVAAIYVAVMASGVIAALVGLRIGLVSLIIALGVLFGWRLRHAARLKHTDNAAPLAHAHDKVYPSAGGRLDGRSSDRIVVG